MKTLSEIAEYACEHLPEGWNIEICLEHGSGFVRLEDPSYEGVEIDTSEMTLVQSVMEAVRVAKESVKDE